jgi:hypothetical protein
MAGVWPVKQGVIRIDGAAYTQWDSNKLGKFIGYLPQDVDLFHGTVAENIARLGLVDDELVVEAAKQAGAHEAILKLPNGYDTPIGEGGTARSLRSRPRSRIGAASSPPGRASRGCRRRSRGGRRRRRPPRCRRRRAVLTSNRSSFFPRGERR